MGSYGDSRNEIKRRMFAFIYAINDIRINPGKKIKPSDGITVSSKIVLEGGCRNSRNQGCGSYDPVVKYVIAEVATNKSLFIKCRK